MKEITYAYDSGSFPRKVYGQSRSASRHYPRYRIKLLPAAAQVIARDHKIRRAECGRGGKEEAILAVPKPVFRGSLRPSYRLR